MLQGKSFCLIKLTHGVGFGKDVSSPFNPHFCIHMVDCKKRQADLLKTGLNCVVQTKFHKLHKQRFINLQRKMLRHEMCVARKLHKTNTVYSLASTARA